MAKLRSTLDDQVIMLWAGMIRDVLMKHAPIGDAAIIAEEIARMIVQRIRAAEAVVSGE
jgi:hypothetical protein